MKVSHNVFFIDQNPASTVIEVAGSDGVGKTTVLLQEAVATILPSVWGPWNIGGQQARAALLDCDLRFSLTRLVELMRHRIRSFARLCDEQGNDIENRSSDKIEDSEIEKIIRASLKRLFISKIHSTRELVATIHSLASNMNGTSVKRILIDGIMAFRWMDRMSGGNRSQTQLLSHRGIANAMKGLEMVCSDSIIITKEQSAEWIQEKSQKYTVRRIGHNTQSRFRTFHICDHGVIDM